MKYTVKSDAWPIGPRHLGNQPRSDRAGPKIWNCRRHRSL